MKKIIYSAVLSGLFFISSNAVNAQHILVNETDINNLPIEYCELRIGQPLNPTKVKVYVDYGQKWTMKRQNIMTPDKKVVKFNSAVHALNFMSKNGWNYVEQTVVQTGETTAYKYLMKKAN